MNPEIATPNPKLKREKLKNWVESSFINKTFFFIAALLFTVFVLFLVYKGITLLDKVQRINTGIVYTTQSGRKYHLYDDCSNMSEPIQTTEKSAIDKNRERCSKCYAGVMDYYEPWYKSIENWDAINWTIFTTGLLAIVLFTSSTILKISNRFNVKTKNDVKLRNVVNIGYAFAIVFAIWWLVTWLYWEVL